MTMQKWNNLGLSLYTVSQSPAVYVVTYFGVVERYSKER